MKKILLSVILSAALLLFIVPQAGAAVRGDVDLNGAVTAADARLALRASVNLEKLNAEKTAAADMNMDGAITAADARLILRKAVGFIDLTEYEQLCSGSYRIKGVLGEKGAQTGEQVEMSFTSDSSYSAFNMDGIKLGVLVKGGRLYMIYDAEKAALEVTPEMGKLFDMNVEEIIEGAEESRFKFEPLEKAAYSSPAGYTDPETGKSIDCTMYAFGTGAEQQVFIKGTEVLLFVSDGSVMDVDFITGEIPASQRGIPSDYTLFTGDEALFEFMAKLPLDFGA